jgi:NADH-quinone oxidoreductase subunit J
MIQFGQAFFYLAAMLALVGALGVVLAKNPIRGAMGLLLMILSIAGLFLALHAEFLAAVQLIVYAGAIVVLFLFVIMLLGPSAVAPSDHRGRIPRIAGAALYAVAGLGMTALLVRSVGDLHAILPSADDEFGTIDSIGKVIFTQALVPFELSSALLMVAIIGAVAVARGRGKHDLHHALSEPNAVSDKEIAS